MGVSRRSTSLPLVGVVAFLATVVFLLYSWNTGLSQNADRRYHLEDDKVSTTSKTVYSAPNANFWSELSPEEAQSIYSFLQANPTLLDANASSPPQIQWLEAIRPNKTDVEALFAGEAKRLDRYARVMIPQDINGTNWLNYYSIGPLPAGAETKFTPLTWPFKNNRYGIKSPLASFEDLQRYGDELGRNISDITEDLFGAKIDRGDPKNPDRLRISVRATWIEDGVASLWVGFLRKGPRSSAWSILPQGLYVKLQARAKGDDQFSAVSWYYNGVFYDEADELRSAISEPGFVRAGRNLDGDWTNTDDLTDNEERNKPPPVMIQPQGPRYRFDRERQYVSYMGWSFYFTSTLSTGPALFDIRFRNESIMYELTLNEAMAHYAGDDPIQGGQEFLDAAFGMGKFAFELVPGYDCPAYSDFVDATYHISGREWTNKRSICIFESTADYLLQRHTSQYQLTLSRNTYLTLRYVATVGNYDYTIDYTFYLDGSLEVKVRASGYIFAAFTSNTSSSPSENKYGYRIHDAISSSMHDHVLSFKADLDIAGTSNAFSRVAIEPLTTSYPWEQPEVPSRNAMSLHTYPVTHETGLDWPRNGGEMYVVSHATARNAWGERRGYRITPGTGMGTPPHLTVEKSTSLGRSAKWAEKDLWVLRRKEEERSSGDPLNWFAPLDPLVDFSSYADNETLHDAPDGKSNSAGKGEKGADLVVYFNLGAHHVPHSGDIPNTLMHTSASGVMFVPHNFFDRDPSRRTAQGVRMELGGGNGAGWMKQHGGSYGREQDGEAGVDVQEKKEGDGVKGLGYFGGRYEEAVCLLGEELEPDLMRYGGGKEGTDLSFGSTIFGGGPG